MTDHDLDRVILACHAARIAFVGTFERLVGVCTGPYACDDREILATIIQVQA